jgi:hypothetical protein
MMASGDGDGVVVVVAKTTGSSTAVIDGAEAE